MPCRRGFRTRRVWWAWAQMRGIKRSSLFCLPRRGLTEKEDLPTTSSKKKNSWRQPGDLSTMTAENARAKGSNPVQCHACTHLAKGAMDRQLTAGKDVSRARIAGKGGRRVAKKKKGYASKTIVIRWASDLRRSRKYVGFSVPRRILRPLSR